MCSASVRSRALLLRWSYADTPFALLQIIQAFSLVVLFASLGFRLSERSDGSGSSGNMSSFRQQLTHILTSPQATHEV